MNLTSSKRAVIAPDWRANAPACPKAGHGTEGQKFECSQGFERPPSCAGRPADQRSFSLRVAFALSPAVSVTVTVTL